MILVTGARHLLRARQICCCALGGGQQWLHDNAGIDRFYHSQQGLHEDTSGAALQPCTSERAPRGHAQQALPTAEYGIASAAGFSPTGLAEQSFGRDKSGMGTGPGQGDLYRASGSGSATDTRTLRGSTGCLG